MVNGIINHLMRTLLRKPTRTSRRDLIRMAGGLSGLWLTAPRLLASPPPRLAASHALTPAAGPKPYGRTALPAAAGMA